MTSSYIAALNGHWVDGTPWKMLDGSFVPLNSANMQTMALMLLGYVWRSATPTRPGRRASGPRMIGSSVQVPIVRPASYAPAWAEKQPGVQVSRTLDVADLLAARHLQLVGATVAADPPLFANEFFLSDVAVTLFLLDAPAAITRMRSRVRFDLQFSDGSADEIIVFQPIAAPALTGLVPADVTDGLLSIGGEIITVGGELISAGHPGSAVTVGGEPIYV